MKKFLALLLALMMIFALGTTAFAANSNDGSITVTNATAGNSYAVYKVFDLTYNGDNVSYTYTKTGDADAFYTALTGGDSPFELAATTDNAVYNVSLKAGQDAASIAKWLDGQKANLTKVAEKTATESTLKFSDLAYGYYFITSEVGAIVTIDSTLKDVKVVDKNQKPGWDNEDPDNPDPDYPENPGKVIINADGTKTVVNSANYGDTVNFNLAVNATAYDGDKLVTYYHITDTLGAGFSAASNIKVLIDGKELTKDTDYTLTQNGNAFSIDIPFGEKYGSNAKIEVTYSATVLDTAVLAGEGNINSANFTYTTDDNFTPDNPPYDPKNPTDPDYPDKPENPQYPTENERKTTTYVYALGILKVDPEGNALQGAEFAVKDAEGNTIWAKGNDGVYEYCKAGTEGAVNQFKTDDNGVLVIKGVEAGKYNVTEMVAPRGYNLLPGATEIEAKLKEAYTTKITTYLDENGKVTNTVTETTKETEAGANVTGLVIVNNAGTELPSTGGMGTTIFYILGGILVAGAVVLLITKKRMSAKS